MNFLPQCCSCGARPKVPADAPISVREQLLVHDWGKLEDIFDRHGAVIIPGDVNSAELAAFDEELRLQDPKLKTTTRYPGRLRYRFGEPAQCQVQGFQHFFNSQKLRLALDRLSVKGSGSTAWRFSYCGGDEVAPMTQNTQTLHSDWPGYKTSSMMRGYAICVSLALRDVPLGFAPMRFRILDAAPSERRLPVAWGRGSVHRGL